MTAENGLNDNTPTEALLEQAWQCYNGYDREQDPALAAEYWLKAAELGSHLAMYNLACVHMHGRGAALDHAKGMELLEKAAALGNVRAQDALRDIAKVGQSHFKVAAKDIDFARRRLYIIIGLIILFALVAAAVITIPNHFGLG